MATIAGFTMLSRIAGMVRDMLTASYLGVGPVADAFFFALKLPNFFRRIAAEGAFDEKLGGWVFRQGRVLTFNPDTGELQDARPFDEEKRPVYHEDPKLMLLIDRRPVDLSFSELHRLIDYLQAENPLKATPYAVRYFSLIADTLGPLVVIAIAIPFAVSGVRVNPAVGVSKSFGLFFLYYILANIASSLATKQLIDPLLAAWLPNLGMTALAVWLFAKLR